MLKILKIKTSTYFYEKSKVLHDKYLNIRLLIKQIFIYNYECYEYRRTRQAIINETGIALSEKVVRRLMKDENLVAYAPKSTKKYSSYKGEISLDVPNVANRKFIVEQPYIHTY